MKIYINNSWQFVPVFDKQILLKKVPSKIKFQTVDIPHSVTELSYNYCSEKEYEKISGYRKTFKTLNQWKNKKVFITFEGAAHEASVYLNGKLIGIHSSGYTAFTFDISDNLAPIGKENVLVVKLDSRESLDVPPFGFMIDYLTYGGIYRDVYLEVKNEIYIDDVFVKTEKNRCSFDISLNDYILEGTRVNLEIFERNKSKEKFSYKYISGQKEKEFTVSIDVPDVKLWSPESPNLYIAKIELCDRDDKEIVFGFRNIEMKPDGFYLNGKKYKIRGLDRHQSFAYTGYAMPESVQRFDCDVLKNELKLNAVRTSHYPQSQDFINACDEKGLLVFTEIPGWQFIGKSQKWLNQCLENVKEMVLQYRNHPSIFMWGVRINESPDDDELYLRTNEIAHKFDPTRPTAGVRSFKNSHLLEDVYTYNDFVHRGINKGCVSKKEVTSDMKKAYMITEYCGHMYSTKIFDTEIQRTEHALRHARVLDAAAFHDDIAGTFGWCAFDYNTHKDFGSGDRICYHGVMDMFRNPKPASFVYKSQCDDEPVLEISTNFDSGDNPDLPRGYNFIFTNADSVKMYFKNVFIKEYFPCESKFKNLKHPPILINDYIGNRFVDEEKMSESTARDAKNIINYVALNTQAVLPLKILFSAVRCFIKGINSSKLTSLYEDYINARGKERNLFKFEAVKDGKVVKTVIKGQSDEVKLSVLSSSKKLKIEKSYDAAVIRIMATDKYSNILSYFSDSVKLKATGAIELIGPDVVSLKGGCAGTFVKTKGKKGKGLLVIECRGMTEKIEFEVK